MVVSVESYCIDTSGVRGSSSVVNGCASLILDSILGMMDHYGVLDWAKMLLHTKVRMTQAVWLWALVLVTKDDGSEQHWFSKKRHIFLFFK